MSMPFQEAKHNIELCALGITGTLKDAAAALIKELGKDAVEKGIDKRVKDAGAVANLSAEQTAAHRGPAGPGR